MGLGLSLAGDFPSSNSYAWTFRLLAVPRAQHSEIATQNQTSSGGNPETNVLELAIGGRITFDRSNELFWRLTHRIEQNRFTGPPSAPDPQTGQYGSGVSVMNSFSVFELGYSWGD